MAVFYPLNLPPSERREACELWREFARATSERGQEQAREKLQCAPMPVQQAIMREVAAQILGTSKKGRNPFE